MRYEVVSVVITVTGTARDNTLAVRNCRVDADGRIKLVISVNVNLFIVFPSLLTIKPISDDSYNLL